MDDETTVEQNDLEATAVDDSSESVNVEELEDSVSGLEQAAALVEKNRKLFARAKQAEQELKELKSRAPARAYSSSEELERVNLRIDGYKEDEVDFIMRSGGRSALKDDFIVEAITARRAKEKAKETSDSASTPASSKSPVLRRHSTDDLKNMPVEEMEKLLRQQGK